MPRPRAVPRSDRGKAILAAIEHKELTLTKAAKHCRVSFRTLYDMIHKDKLDSMSLATIERICTRLDLPLKLISPVLARHSA